MKMPARLTLSAPSQTIQFSFSAARIRFSGGRWRVVGCGLSGAWDAGLAGAVHWTAGLGEGVGSGLCCRGGGVWARDGSS